MLQCCSSLWLIVPRSSWESPGNNTDTAVSDPAQCHLGSRCGDYQLATMLHEMDPFGHATTYEEENVTLYVTLDTCSLPTHFPTQSRQVCVAQAAWD